MPSRRRPPSGSSIPGDALARALTADMEPAWDAWSSATAGLWQGLGVGLDLQQQMLQRWALRQQEWVRHSAQPISPAAWLDAALAGMRWGSQEWQQAMQDAMAASFLGWRQVAPGCSEPVLDWCGRTAWQPLQAWAELWSAAGRRPER